MGNKKEKAEKRLAVRVHSYDETMKRLKGSEAQGFKKPGSKRLRKGH